MIGIEKFKKITDIKSIKWGFDLVVVTLLLFVVAAYSEEISIPGEELINSDPYPKTFGIVSVEPGTIEADQGDGMRMNVTFFADQAATNTCAYYIFAKNYNGFQVAGGYKSYNFAAGEQTLPIVFTAYGNDDGDYTVYIQKEYSNGTVVLSDYVGTFTVNHIDR